MMARMILEAAFGWMIFLAAIVQFPSVIHDAAMGVDIGAIQPRTGLMVALGSLSMLAFGALWAVKSTFDLLSRFAGEG